MPSAKCGGFKNEDVGKFLVLRRDGTVPSWTWFVLGAMDPYTPAALRAYAQSVWRSVDKTMIQYGNDVMEASGAFEQERQSREKNGTKKGDPEKGPHRKDSQLILKLLRGEVTFEQIERALDAAGVKL